MVTAEDALKSEDPKEVKRLRGSISTQISCDINLLQKELSKKLENGFDYEKISPQLIKTQKKKLLGHFDLIQKLHERFMEVREEGLDEQAEQELIALDMNYSEDITSKVCLVLDTIDRYEEGYSNLIKCKSQLKSEGGIKEAIIKSKHEFNVVHDKIKAELDKIESQDNTEVKDKLIQLIPTESYARDLSISFNEIKKACNKLKDIRLASNKDGSESKLEYNYNEEHSIFFSLDMKLKTYEQAKTLLKNKDSSAKISADSEKCTPLKINNPEALKFSGEARDYASFKRDFMAIVVPHRDSAQIGMHFKNAIPEKHRHLISNKDLVDWEAMMSTIEDELANPKLIVDRTVGEIERMRTPATDKAFIEFVEALEKIVRDLTTLEQLSEVANTAVLSKLESKLPSQINHDWTQKVISLKLSKKTSSEKFDSFMDFLRDAKEMTKYTLALPNNSGKNHCFVTGSFVTQNKGDLRDVPGKAKTVNILPCLACSIDGATDLTISSHHMNSCAVWGSLSHRERVSLVKCIKHPFSKDGHLTKECKRNIRTCTHCNKENEHNSLLCPKFQVVKKSSTNISRKALALASRHPGSPPDLAPTLLYTMFVKTKGSKRLGTLIDHGSTDDYVLNSVAKRMKLRGYPVELITEGFGGVETRINTNLYYVPIYDK